MFKTTRIKCLLGDSEKAVREIFQRAKDCEPCLIFFDEFDALCPERSSTVIFYKQLKYKYFMFFRALIIIKLFVIQVKIKCLKFSLFNKFLKQVNLDKNKTN